MPSGGGFPSPSASAGKPGANDGPGSEGDAASPAEATTGDSGDAGTGESTGNSAEPGFGDIAGADALPDMRDELPTFDESYGGGQGADGMGDMADAGGDAGTNGGADPAAATGASGSVEPGTRAQGGMEGVATGSDILTTAEQVAILDRQLEQSTSDFDAMILEEQQRQREEARERADRSAEREQPEPAGAGTSGRSPYNDDVAMGGGGSTGGGMGGASRGGGAPPDNPAIYKAPEDIPDGSNDDVVARQLREAAMREPDPAVRERLWNEYRKYKGLEIPES